MQCLLTGLSICGTWKTSWPSAIKIIRKADGDAASEVDTPVYVQLYMYTSEYRKDLESHWRTYNVCLISHWFWMSCCRPHQQVNEAECLLRHHKDHKIHQSRVALSKICCWMWLPPWGIRKRLELQASLNQQKMIQRTLHWHHRKTITFQ